LGINWFFLFIESFAAPAWLLKMRVMTRPGCLLLFLSFSFGPAAFSFTIPHSSLVAHNSQQQQRHHFVSSVNPFRRSRSETAGLKASSFEEEPEGDDSSTAELIYGLGGTLLAPVVLYSEFTLKTTGCGLPAGPFGSLGLAEGVGYLSVIAFCFWSFGTKQRTGSGLPAGPYGLLGAAEGLSWLAGLGGLAVLGFQLADYGFVPEAIPTEGGRCSNI
jgi:hypothetical protein